MNNNYKFMLNPYKVNQRIMKKIIQSFFKTRRNERIKLKIMKQKNYTPLFFSNFY